MRRNGAPALILPGPLEHREGVSQVLGNKQKTGTGSGLPWCCAKETKEPNLVAKSGLFL